MSLYQHALTGEIREMESVPPHKVELWQAYTPPEVPLPDRRAALWEQIKATRDRLSDEGGYSVTVNGTPKWFHSDGKSKTQQLALTMLGANVPSVPWKTMDGSFVTMSQPLAAAIFQAALSMDMALFAHAESLKAQVEASEDPSSIDISTGWPATYTSQG